MGYLHVEAPEAGHLICVLPSLLHSRYIEYTYGRPALPSRSYDSIQHLALKCLRRFSKSMFLMAKSGQRYGPTGKPRSVEAAYQDEIYRCFCEELGPGAGIVSESSCPGQGRIYFFHVPTGWGLEVLRDGSRLSEHCGRFEPGGKVPSSNQSGSYDGLVVTRL